MLRKGGRAEVRVLPAPALGGSGGGIFGTGGSGSVVGSSSGGVKSQSLLTAAVERGFSADGEIFNADHLATLATEICGLQAVVKTLTGELSPAAVAKLVLEGAMVILPCVENENEHKCRAPCGFYVAN
jgi:hypothetical protein